MTRAPQWASDLAVKIDQTWRGGPTTHVWEEELADLDEGRANTAYVRLRRILKQAPSIALFFEMYHSVRTDDASTRPPACPHCDGLGWVEATPLLIPAAHGTVVRTEIDGEHRFREVTQWAPCGRCTVGREMERVHRSILATNNRNRTQETAA